MAKIPVNIDSVSSVEVDAIKANTDYWKNKYEEQERLTKQWCQAYHKMAHLYHIMRDKYELAVGVNKQEALDELSSLDENIKISFYDRDFKLAKDVNVDGKMVDGHSTVGIIVRGLRNGLKNVTDDGKWKVHLPNSHSFADVRSFFVHDDKVQVFLGKEEKYATT